MENDSPKIAIHPMIIVLVYIVLGSILRRVWPLSIPDFEWLFYAGCALIAIGIGVLLLAVKEFSKKQANIGFTTSSTALVTEGIYKYTRNPMYLAFVINFIGISLAFNGFWDLVLIIPLVIALNQMVLVKEEAYLLEKFREEYKNYKNSVRRWI